MWLNLQSSLEPALAVSDKPRNKMWWGVTWLFLEEAVVCACACVRMCTPQRGSHVGKPCDYGAFLQAAWHPFSLLPQYGPRVFNLWLTRNHIALYIFTHLLPFHNPYSNPSGVKTHYYTHSICLYYYQCYHGRIKCQIIIFQTRTLSNMLLSLFCFVICVSFASNLGLCRLSILWKLNCVAHLEQWTRISNLFIFIKQLVHHVCACVLNIRPVVHWVNWSSSGSEEDPGVRLVFICTWTSGLSVKWSGHQGSCAKYLFKFFASDFMGNMSRAILVAKVQTPFMCFSRFQKRKEPLCFKYCDKM